MCAIAHKQADPTRRNLCQAWEPTPTELAVADAGTAFAEAITTSQNLNDVHVTPREVSEPRDRPNYLTWTKELLKLISLDVCGISLPSNAGAKWEENSALIDAAVRGLSARLAEWREERKKQLPQARYDALSSAEAQKWLLWLRNLRTYTFLEAVEWTSREDQAAGIAHAAGMIAQTDLNQPHNEAVLAPPLSDFAFEEHHDSDGAGSHSWNSAHRGEDTIWAAGDYAEPGAHHEAAILGSAPNHAAAAFHTHGAWSHTAGHCAPPVPAGQAIPPSGGQVLQHYVIPQVPGAVPFRAPAGVPPFPLLPSHPSVPRSHQQHFYSEEMLGHHPRIARRIAYKVYGFDPEAWEAERGTRTDM
ncbi:hypothetical protein JCM10908_001369 [Rhodotorula pacifica]|uniref:uncharacterized protein n=1 Tax=Rhodotorula pacifica TaxID=1495444 RepID=UPI00317E3492